MSPGTVVAGFGVTTAVGASTQQSCAALRAGIARFSESDLHLCRGFDPEQEDLEPALVARVPVVDPALEGAERLIALLLPALRDAVRDAAVTPAELATAHVGLVGPPATRPGAPVVDEALLSELYRRAGAPTPTRVQIVRSGHSGFGEALQAALAGLAAEPQRTALVLCADSLLCHETLVWLDAQDRLKCSRSPEGVVAGEGAAVLVLRGAAVVPAAAAPVRASVCAVGVAREENTVLVPERPCTGTGLCEAVRAAAAGLAAGQPNDWVILDHTGERHAALEWGYVIARLHAVFGRLQHSWYVADCIGDTGAAAGGIAAARALAAWQRGYAPAQRAWVLAGSDEGGRAAVVFEAPPGAGAPPAHASGAPTLRGGA